MREECQLSIILDYLVPSQFDDQSLKEEVSDQDENIQINLYG